jgi:hypothetical protein
VDEVGRAPPSLLHGDRAHESQLVLEQQSGALQSDAQQRMGPVAQRAELAREHHLDLVVAQPVADREQLVQRAGDLGGTALGVEPQPVESADQSGPAGAPFAVGHILTTCAVNGLPLGCAHLFSSYSSVFILTRFSVSSLSMSDRWTFLWNRSVWMTIP